MVAHHEIPARGDDQFVEGASVFKVPRDIGFLDTFPIDVDAAAIDAQIVSGSCDYPLDVALLRIARVVENDGVAALDLLEVIDELVDEEAILILQLRQHAGSLHLYGLVEEGDDEER